MSFTNLLFYPWRWSPKYTLNRRLRGSHGRSGSCGERKNLPPSGNITPDLPIWGSSLYQLNYPDFKISINTDTKAYGCYFISLICVSFLLPTGINCEFWEQFDMYEQPLPHLPTEIFDAEVDRLCMSTGYYSRPNWLVTPEPKPLHLM
jgi:hypothetical protein